MLPSNFICFNSSTLPLGIKLEHLEKGMLADRQDLVAGVPDSYTTIVNISEYNFMKDDSICIVYDDGSYSIFKVLENYCDLVDLFCHMKKVTIVNKSDNLIIVLKNNDKKEKEKFFSLVDSFSFSSFSVRYKKDFIPDSIQGEILDQYVRTKLGV
jgi:hypothetical protein